MTISLFVHGHLKPNLPLSGNPENALVEPHVPGDEESRSMENAMSNVGQRQQHQSPSGSVGVEASDTTGTPESKTVDSWIDELQEFQETVHAVETSNLSMSQLPFRIESSRDIPVMKIELFDGDPLQYVEFVQRFKTHIHDKVHLTDETRIAQLKMHLSGEAKKTLSGLGLSGNMYAAALKTLKDQFGELSRIARAFINKVSKGPKIHDKFSLKELSIDIINTVANLKQLSYFADMNSSDTLRQIVERLPNYVIDRWKTKVGSIRTNGDRPTISHMDTFLRAIVKAEFDPDFGDIRRSHTSKPVPPSYPNRRPINTSERSHQETSPKQIVKACFLCQENHRLSECNKFRCLDTRHKFEHVTSQHLCFSCLLVGHNIFRCRRKNPCGINNCRRYHYRLLHSDPLVTSTILGHSAMLPVVRVTFKAPNGRTLRRNVLIDGGSGTIAIRTGFSTALGLQGRQERLDISGVGGVQVTQRFSRRVNFKISALDGVEEFNMEAYELDKTVMDVPDLDREWLQSFNHLHVISFSQTSGPVDLYLKSSIVISMLI